MRPERRASLTLPRLGTRRPLAAPVTLSLCLGATIGMLALVSGLAVTPLLVLVGFLRFGLAGLCLLTLMNVPGVDGRNMGVASGLFFTAGEIGGFSGPFAVGAIGDATGGFGASLLTLTGAAVLQAYLFTVIHRRITRAGSAPPERPPPRRAACPRHLRWRTAEGTNDSPEPPGAEKPSAKLALSADCAERACMSHNVA